MTLPTKITVIGTGSASFGENTFSAIMRSKKLKGSTLALVDKNAESLDIVHRLADRLNREWKSDINITAHTHHTEALAGSDFVVSAIEVGARENLWQRDFETSLKYNVRQPYAENGGPGGFAHAARNIGPILQIAQDVDAAVEGNREKALQCLLLDPVITDIDTAKKILDDYLTSYKEYLPQFWM